jgi:N-methylhydantoinase B/oxoprolinase/acetone carboxylase alpha subunit
VRRKDGRMERLQGCDETTIDADEAIIIQTPTAGGYGDPRERSSDQSSPGTASGRKRSSV